MLDIMTEATGVEATHLPGHTTPASRKVPAGTNRESLRGQAAYLTQPHWGCPVSRAWSIVGSLCLSTAYMPPHHTDKGVIQYAAPRTIQGNLQTAIAIALSIS